MSAITKVADSLILGFRIAPVCSSLRWLSNIFIVTSFEHRQATIADTTTLLLKTDLDFDLARGVGGLLVALRERHSCSENTAQHSGQEQQLGDPQQIV